MNHSTPPTDGSLSPGKILKESVNALKTYDDLEEILRESETLIISLLTTDFIENVEPGHLKNYIRCLQKQIQQALILTDQFGYYFGYIGD